MYVSLPAMFNQLITTVTCPNVPTEALNVFQYIYWSMLEGRGEWG